jgi:hypothetical protein
MRVPKWAGSSCVAFQDGHCVNVQSCLMVAFRRPHSGVEPSGSVIMALIKAQMHGFQLHLRQ